MNYAIILAAGKGSRMKGTLPKCAMTILGKPMISYLTESIKKTSLDEIICVVGYKKEIIASILKDTVSYRIQEEQLGSGHAARCCRDIDKEGYTVILNGDTPFVDNILLQQLINTHLENKNDLTIATFINPSPQGYGRIIRDKTNKIQAIAEEAELTEEQKQIQEVNGGVLCVRTKLLFEALDRITNNNQRKEYYLTDIVKELADFKISEFRTEDSFKLMGINTLSQLAEAEKKLKESILDKHLQNGVKIENKDNVYIGSDVIIEENTVIRNSTILGNTVIHQGSEIIDSEIRNSIVLNDSTIWHSVVCDSVVGKNCTVGPFAHIRSNSFIAGNNRVGNYVEIKNSRVGLSSKLSHLAYMGDCLCGENVNFGCGSITVNYDGKTKHKTSIGDNVFVGCNSNLIAPISIESNSFIAAGSTITDNMEQGDFAIARSLQVTKKGYASKYDSKE